MMNSSQTFYDSFKPIRNTISKIRKDDILLFCFKYLNEIWGLNSLEVHNKHLPMPWHLFLMLKWSMVYGPNYYEGKHIQINKFIEIYNQIKDLPANLDWEASSDSLYIWKMVRSLMTGQMPYMRRYGYHGLLSYDIMINNIGIKYDIEKKVIELTGLKIQDFIDYQFILEGKVRQDKKRESFNFNYFSKIKNQEIRKKIRRFLDFISLDFNALELFCQKDSKNLNNAEYEFNLLTPIWKKPLFKSNGNYISYHKSLSNQFTHYGLHETLRAADSVDYSGAFGICYEDYLTYSLSRYSHSYKREKEIRKEFNVSRAVDFLLKEDKKTLLIEAKSANISDLFYHNQSQEYREQILQNSVIKAYIQIFKTAYELQIRTPKKFKNDEFWALIVVYKEHLIGAPEEIWSELLKEKIDHELGSINSNLKIDYLKIFTISVYDFEILIHYCLKKSLSIFDILQMIYVKNQQKETKKMTFDMYLSDVDIKLSEIDHIKNKIEEISERVKTIL